jgi:hypothetical protein
MMNEALSCVLDREFQRLADEPKLEEWPSHFRTLGNQALFLGVNKSTLSRLRNGKARLNPELARRFSQKLRKAAGEQETLCRELEAAGTQQEDRGPLNVEQLLQTGDVHSAKELFKRLANPGSFVGVEYRDLPRADPSGKYRVYADFASEAIQKGLSFAMFQPFGNAFEPKGEGYQTKIVRDYIWNLRKKVREVYLSMLKKALDTDKPKTEAEELEIAGRLMLYERGNDPEDRFRYNFCSGIQSRMFYAEIKKAETVEREVWEWVAAPSRDFFVPRDESSMPRDVIAEQFFPVIRYWNAHQKLPQSDKAIEETITKQNKLLEANLPVWIWRVYLTPQKALEELAKSTSGV